MSEKPTTEDVLKWAREAGFQDWAVYGRIERKEDCLNYFAALAYAAGASAEREAIADAVIKCDPRATLKGIAAAIRAKREKNE